MNTRITLSAALGATALFALAPAQAQAPSIATSQLEAKVQAMQNQINSLQAQVQKLQQQLRNATPSVVTGPTHQMPKFTVPNFSVPNFSVPNSNGQGFNGQGFSAPNNQAPFNMLQPPSRDNSIPNYTATFITQVGH